MSARPVWPVFAVLASVGCVGAAVDAPVPSAAIAPPDVGPVTLAWEGFLRVGGGMEIPGHTREVDALTRDAWSSSFELVIEEPPEWVEISLDWTAVAAEILLMTGPPEDDGPPVVHQTPYAMSGPLCMRIAGEQLVPGAWPTMAHSRVAVDAKLSFTILVMGGAATVADHAHEVPTASIAGSIVEQKAGEWEACEASGRASR